MIPTKTLDRKFRGLPRLKKASGTTDPKVFRRMNHALDTLYEDGRLDILRAVIDGTVSPMQVYEAHRLGDFSRLALGQSAQPLHAEYEAWRVRATTNAKSLISRAQAGRYLETYGKASSLVHDLPAILLSARKAMERKGHAATFNRLKAAVQAFVRDTMGKGSALYRELTGIERLVEVTTVARRPMTPGQLRQALEPLDDWTMEAAWGMASTGMGPGEYWGEWEATPAYVHIHGTKRKARDRKVPYLNGFTLQPNVSRQVFEDRLVKAGAPFKPYDLRRSYANWLESAGVKPTNVRLYMGHAAQSVTDIYLGHDILRDLAEDTVKLRAYIDRELARPALTLEKAE